LDFSSNLLGAYYLLVALLDASQPRLHPSKTTLPSRFPPGLDPSINFLSEYSKIDVNHPDKVS